MAKHAQQYTIRNVPANVDRALRRRAKETGQSFNQVAVEALAIGAGEPTGPKRDLTGIAGSVGTREAERIEEEIKRQRRIDPELWR